MDLRDAVTLSRSHLDNVLIVKYEELVTRPLDVIPIILKVLGDIFEMRFGMSRP